MAGQKKCRARAVEVAAAAAAAWGLWSCRVAVGLKLALGIAEWLMLF
jgi:hypothetical protein